MQKWLEKVLPQHKYAINAKRLGDDAVLAWTNLGYWTETHMSYVQACQALADHLAHAVELNSADYVLDLGCGQGASLEHWKKNYQPQRIEAVELQADCVERIQQCCVGVGRVYKQSFLELDQLKAIKPFTVILCIDAAYHYDLTLFLQSISTVLAENGRIGFHTLILTEKWLQLTVFQQFRYRMLLKSADINLNHLMFHKDLVQTLSEYAFIEINIENLSESVLAGFADYIGQKKMKINHLDALKINMTAKLCQKLYQDGLVNYVQVTAQKHG